MLPLALTGGFGLNKAEAVMWFLMLKVKHVAFALSLSRYLA
ncbi:hypothetical protein [Iodobacter fluviatilis]|jgi:hypothetical protein|nr:hypothetical protein [Iodobacter fluviatilis]